MTDVIEPFFEPSPDSSPDSSHELEGAARSVSELIDDINVVLVREFRDVWVYGEVTKVSNPSSGHCYFDLVEDVDGEKKMIAVKLFKGVRQRLVPKMKQHEMDIVSGIKVRIRGTPDLYGPSGSFGFKMSDIDPRFTLGDLAVKRDEIIDRLKKEGLYDRNRRATLPLVPLSIGLVASKGTAAHADFMKTLEQSNIGFSVSLCDVRVQGDGAASGVAGAIALFSGLPDVDLVAVIRGGGSRVDLATFDDELIARAIAACRKPVFTGIGHEVDTSIADEVAYSWNKTPTACAVSIINKVEEFVRQVDGSAQRIATVVLAALANGERRIANAAGRLRTLRTMGLDSAKSRINELAAQIAGFDPVILMRRGWSITYDADGAVLRSVNKVNKKAEITTRLADGTLVSTVTRAAESAESSSKK